MKVNRETFFEALQQRSQWVAEVFGQDQYQTRFKPESLREAVYSYLSRPAKRFRPGLVFFSCGAVGGDESRARLAAAAVEVYHTWTLVHDDIIDNDSKRRGCATVHEAYRLKALEWGYGPKEAADLGRNVAILTGDLQHAWAVSLLLDSVKLGVPAQVVMRLIGRMEDQLTNGLVEGEALDVLFAAKPIEELSEEEVLRMLELKTGVLYEFSAMAGAAIGLGQSPEENGRIEAIGRFARQCGTAFQLQDDILGIVGDEKILGKAVGADIREGKRTVIVLRAFANAGPKDRRRLMEVLGDAAASEEQIQTVKHILSEYNGIEYTQNLARRIVDQAVGEIASLPESKYKDLLLSWADYVIDRKY